MSPESPSLHKAEWVLFLAMVLLILSSLVIAKKTSFRSLQKLRAEECSFPKQILSIEVLGCVQRPGVYKVPQGVAVRSVLRKARPKPFADLQAIFLDRILDESCSIYLPVLEKISIAVSGAVKENILIVLPAGSRFSDLKGKVVLSEDADITIFKQRRLLKNGESVVIPVRDKKLK